MASVAPKVAVVMGGPSAEHAISVKSGRGVVAALLRRGWSVHPILLLETLTAEEAARAARTLLAATEPDVVFIALHGPFGEDGAMQVVCEELGLAYTGSDPSASRLGLDKVASRERAARAGLQVPRWRLLDVGDHAGLAACIAEWQFPVVVKPRDQGSSLGVSIITHQAQAAGALAAAGRYGPQALVEAFVRGRELTVGIVDEEALPVIEIRPTTQRFFDYTAKYTPGQTDYLVPAPLEAAVAARVQAAALRAHQALGCRHFSRVDLILSEAGEPVVLEVNTIPGLTATSLLPKAAACVGVSYEDLCERLVMMALETAGPVEPVGQLSRLTG